MMDNYGKQEKKRMKKKKEEIRETQRRVRVVKYGGKKEQEKD